MKQIIVVGGGASGMMAAVVSAMNKNRVLLLEQNDKLGKKIYITGKGRCNLTNTAQKEEFFSNVFAGKKFSYSCIYGFDSDMLLDLLKSAGLETVTERGGRVFPASGKASDVTKALTNLMRKNNVEVRLNTKVSKIGVDLGSVSYVITDSGEKIDCDGVILCCGGKSYPTTGSDGSGYTLCESLGHTIKPVSPALVPLISSERWVGSLSGLSLKNVTATLTQKGKKVASEFGEMLFTHKGLSGPIILSLSCLITDFSDTYIMLDLKPALDHETLSDRVVRDFESVKNKSFKNSLDLLLPKSLAQELVGLSGIDPEKKINQITVSERRKIVNLLKALPVKITATAGFNEAIISKGGVDISQINPSTMESKLVKGLYFAGEIIDMHAFTGGYNLQLAFSSGHLAGESV